MSGREVELIRVTAEDCQREINAIYDKHPKLRDWIPSCRCRSPWCDSALTADEQHAADLLLDWLFLLEPRND